MNSGFPGMDPYLEPRWSDVYGSLLQEIEKVLQPALPEGLRARTEERLLLEVEGDARRGYRSDVVVVEGSHSAPLAAAGRVAGNAAVIVEFPEDTPVDSWIQIIDSRDGNRVITAIELLSPENKASGHLNKLYQRKVRHYARGGVNLVEIDLLRTSRARLKVRWNDLPSESRADYLTCVRRGNGPPKWECFSTLLRRPVAAFPVPLRGTDADVWLDLQPLIETAYSDGAHNDLDYSVPPEPPFTAKDQGWADNLLRTARKRS